MSRSLLRLWALFLLLKLIVSAWLPMTPDEAYYWVWSKHLQLSYYDHPGMVAWLMWLGEPLVNFARAVRWPTVLMGHLTVLVWLVLLREMLGERQLKLFLWLALLAPLVGVGSIVVTPDVPLVFFWSCALLCLKEALNGGQRRWYILLGVSLGLGFCSKYPIVLFVPILLAWLTFEKHWSEVNWRRAGMTVVVGLLCCFPVLYWNYLHDFVSFRFQMRHGLGEQHWNINWTLQYLGSQILLIFPPLLYILLSPAARGSRSWLFYFAWGPLLFFFVTSFRGSVEANWPIAAYPALLALAVVSADQVRWGRQALQISLALWLIASVVVVSNTAYPWLPIEQFSARYQVMQEYLKLKEIAQKYKPLYAGNYQIAALLSFETKTLINKAHGYSRQDFFDYLPESLPTEPVYFVIIEKEQYLPELLIKLGHHTVSRDRIDKHHFLIENHRE